MQISLISHESRNKRVVLLGSANEEVEERGELPCQRKIQSPSHWQTASFLRAGPGLSHRRTDDTRRITIVCHDQRKIWKMNLFCSVLELISASY